MPAQSKMANAAQISPDIALTLFQVLFCIPKLWGKLQRAASVYLPKLLTAEIAKKSRKVRKENHWRVKTDYPGESAAISPTRFGPITSVTCSSKLVYLPCEYGLQISPFLPR
jgi:hypothetical protein